MSQKSPNEARQEWDEVIGLLERDSADCGAMLRELATIEGRPKRRNDERFLSFALRRGR
jgi:hypothetical protein